jgi:pimeloyl-ACP methyl ester carboxylesterase
MEEIRKALGVRRISFYGYSYGTYLGQVYATVFPTRIHRMVLDSNVDPRQIWYAGGEAQTRALQRVFDLFFAWIARHHRVYRLGRTGAVVERRYLRERAALRGSPGRGVLGPSEYDDAFLPAAYLQLAWPLLADSFVALARRDNPGPLIRIWRLVDAPGNDNQYAVFNAVTCTDAPWPDLSRVLTDARRLYRVAPVVTWASTWSTGPCAFWPAEPGTPVSVRDSGVRPLLVGQTLDGATPFSASLGVRSIFRGSRLIAIRGGTTHASTPDLSGPCVNVRLAAYLRTGALPPRKPGRRADVTCPAPRPPQPVAAAGRGTLRTALGVRLFR